jgi:cytochrome c oxidase subunit 2
MRRFFFLPFAALIWASGVYAQEPAELYQEFGYCLVCHGAQGQGNSAIAAPALVGIEPWYLLEQIANYQAGERKIGISGQEMSDVAREISTESSQRLVAFTSLIDGVYPHANQVGDAEVGKVQYQTTCAACHGLNGEGNSVLLSPGLARLSDWYLTSSFEQYRSGDRGLHSTNASALQMRSVFQLLPPDFNVADVVAYIRTLSIIEEE